MNGTAMWWRGNAIKPSELCAFFVDVNGPLPPNQWGKDLFSFEYNLNNGFVPQGRSDGSYPYENYCINGNFGYGCAYYVLTTGKMDY